MSTPEQMIADFRIGRTDLAEWLYRHAVEGWQTDGDPVTIPVDGAVYWRYTFTRIPTPFKP